MDTADLCEVVITAPDPDWLTEFTGLLLVDRLCAAVHQIHAVNSQYRWHGEIRQAREARVTLRTRTALVPAIVARTQQAHPYEVPSVVALPIVAANPRYAQWIRDETAFAPEA